MQGTTGVSQVLSALLHGVCTVYTRAEQADYPKNAMEPSANESPIETIVSAGEEASSEEWPRETQISPANKKTGQGSGADLPVSSQS